MPENTDDKNVVTMPDGRRFRVNDDGSVTVLDGAQGIESMPAEKEDKEAQQKAGDAFKQGKGNLSAMSRKSKWFREQSWMEPQLPLEPFEAEVDKLIHILEQLRMTAVQPEQLSLEQLETLARLVGPGPKQEKVLALLDKMKRIQKQVETLTRLMEPRPEKEKVKMLADLDKMKLCVGQVEDMARLMGPGPEQEKVLADLDKMKLIQKQLEILAHGGRK